ncbi:hypothetical protein H7J92_09305 [Sporosarcina aquimarina]|nr:hypothetical protein [Sporosarcina aquimarina]
MEVGFMVSNYNCSIDILFSNGDIQFDVTNGTQLFSFKSGIGFIAIPVFFSTLSSLYKGEISEAELVCHGNYDYYLFSTDGTNLFIEHVSHFPDGVFKYEFNLKKYIAVICTGFQKFLKQLEKEGILPVKSQEFAHPLGDDILNAFNGFSSHLSH